MVETFLFNAAILISKIEENEPQILTSYWSQGLLHYVRLDSEKLASKVSKNETEFAVIGKKFYASFDAVQSVCLIYPLESSFFRYPERVSRTQLSYEI